MGESLNYAFASELGTGIYSLSGRTLQIYRITLSKQLAESTEGRAGVRLVMPMTVGFFDFATHDLLDGELPSRIDSFSMVPSIEFDISVAKDWRLIPYLRGGYTVASSSVEGLVYGGGMGLERKVPWRGWDTFLRSEVTLTGVSYREGVGNDRFARVRQAVEIRRSAKVVAGMRDIEFGLYGIADGMIDPPTLSVENATHQFLQLEAGLVIAGRPQPRIWRFDAPRVGLGYRFSGPYSGWRFVIGAPF